MLNFPHLLGDFEEQLLAEICEPQKVRSKPEPKTERITGLPEPVLCTVDGRDNTKTWEEIGESGESVDYDTILKLIPDEKGTKLSKIVINMDSTVFIEYRNNQKTPEAVQIAENRYVSSVFLHSIFLFASAKNGSYSISQFGKNSEPDIVELEEFISRIFSSTYAQFLLNFEISDLLDVLS